VISLFKGILWQLVDLGKPCSYQKNPVLVDLGSPSSLNARHSRSPYDIMEVFLGRS